MPTKQQIALELIKQGYSRMEIARLMGYKSVQPVHCLLYEASKPRTKRVDNVDRVRKYLIENPNCRWKEIGIDLDISINTVNRALRLIGGRDDTGRGGYRKNSRAGLGTGGPETVSDPGG